MTRRPFAEIDWIGPLGDDATDEPAERLSPR
jgi:hypothetical protein